MLPTYDPSVFYVASLKQAKAIILTPEGLGTEARWEKETPWLAELAISKLGLSASSKVLDYGCGVGRIARALIEGSGCRVFGLDISSAMRALAPGYVDSPNFRILAEGVQPPIVDSVVSVWVLQHAEQPEADLDLILSVLQPGGKFFLVNNVQRALPVSFRGQGKQFVQDKVDFEELLRERFRVLEEGRLPVELCLWGQPDLTYWKILQAR